MALEDGAGLADEFLPGVAGDLLHGLVDRQDHPLHVHHQQAVHHGVNDGLPEVLLAFFKQGLWNILPVSIGSSSQVRLLGRMMDP